METFSKTSHDAREFRRLRAVELYEQGWRPVRIAEALGVTRGAVSQWLKRMSKSFYQRRRMDDSNWNASLRIHLT